MALAIGFASRFYTLWDIDTFERTIGLGQKEIVTRHSYLKNISLDKDKALSQYPSAPFIEDLRGKTASWDSKKVVWTDVTTFRFGKYCGTPVDDCADTDYIVWYYRQSLENDHREHVGKVLVSRGCELRERVYNLSSGLLREPYAVTPEYLEKERKEEEEADAFKAVLDSGKPLEVPVDYNPDSDGCFRYEDAIYRFDEVRENWYKGFPYYLPVLDGKQKRVKGKTIIVDSYDWEEDDGYLYVNVHHFSVCK